MGPAPMLRVAGPPAAEGQPGAPSSTCSHTRSGCEGRWGARAGRGARARGWVPSQGPTPCRPAPAGPADCGGARRGRGCPAGCPRSLLPARPPAQWAWQRLLPAWPAGRHLPSDRNVRNRASSVSPRPWLSGTLGAAGVACRASVRPGHRPPCRVLNGAVHPVPSVRGALSPGPPTLACCGSLACSPVFPAKATC